MSAGPVGLKPDGHVLRTVELAEHVVTAGWVSAHGAPAGALDRSSAG